MSTLIVHAMSVVLAKLVLVVGLYQLMVCTAGASVTLNAHVCHSVVQHEISTMSNFYPLKRILSLSKPKFKSV